MVTKITGDTIPSEVQSGVSVIDFSATWCGPCKMLAPVLDEVAEELAGKISFYNADVDENPSLAEKYNIMNIPALVVIKDGEQVDTQVGFQPKENLMKAFEKFM